MEWVLSSNYDLISRIFTIVCIFFFNKHKYLQRSFKGTDYGILNFMGDENFLVDGTNVRGRGLLMITITENG